MCIAILNTKGIISKKTLRTCWENNGDGAGLALWTGSELITHKEMKSFKSFYSHYVGVRNEYKRADIAIHFRIATHGEINAMNCHPFHVDAEHALIHNGIIAGHGDAIHSDTLCFTEDIMQGFPIDSLYSDSMMLLIENYIGTSKIVMVGRNGSIIYNEAFGEWDGDNWFSNRSYMDYGGVKSWKPKSRYIWEEYDYPMGGIVDGWDA